MCEAHIQAHRVLIHFQCFYQCTSAVSETKFLVVRGTNSSDKLYQSQWNKSSDNRSFLACCDVRV